MSPILIGGLQSDNVATAWWVNGAVEIENADAPKWCPKDRKQPNLKNDAYCAAMQLIKGKPQITGRPCTDKLEYACLVRD
jgi:hypothetical protein